MDKTQIEEDERVFEKCAYHRVGTCVGCGFNGSNCHFREFAHKLSPLMFCIHALMKRNKALELALKQNALVICDVCINSDASKVDSAGFRERCKEMCGKGDGYKGFVFDAARFSKEEWL